MTKGRFNDPPQRIQGLSLRRTHNASPLFVGEEGVTVTVYDPSHEDNESFSFEGEGKLPFELLQTLVGGYVQCVPVTHKEQLLCNEDGLSLGLRPNPAIARLYAGKVNFGPGPVGVWIKLTGKDLLT